MKPVTVRIDEHLRRKHIRHVRIGRLLHKLPLLRKLLLRLRDAFVSVREDPVNYQDDLDYGTRPHGATKPFNDIRAFTKYAAEVNDPKFATVWTLPAEEMIKVGTTTEASAALFKKQVDVLTELLTRETTVGTILNFGVSYAYMDSLLAKRFPGRAFCGIDLSKYTQALNKIEFGHMKNMKFFHGDVFELLDREDFTSDLLLHSRTLCTLPQSFVENLYGTCFEKGLRYIVGFEQFGLPRPHCEPFTFDETDKPSVHWRNLLSIHNYPGIAVKCGFHIETAFAFEISRWSPDYRVLCFVAKRT